MFLRKTRLHGSEDLVGTSGQQRVLEFRQSHSVKDFPNKSIKKPHSYEWWTENHLIKWILQDPNSEIGKRWLFRNGEPRTTQSQKEILSTLKNIFLRYKFTFLHVVHLKGDPRKYVWRTDRKSVVKKPDGSDLKNDDGSMRTTSRSMMAISFIVVENKDVESKLNDECSLSEDQQHLKLCIEFNYTSSLEIVSDEDKDDEEAPENGNSDGSSDEDQPSEMEQEMDMEMQDNQRYANGVIEKDLDDDRDEELIPDDNHDIIDQEIV